jgi:hypothetical protein
MTNEYWTNEVEEAVANYAACIDVDERNSIYMKYLHQAFQKLIDDVIKRYRPDWEGHNEREIKNDLLSILVEHIRRYNPTIAISRGYKPNARIYCSTIIRSAIADQRVKSYKEKQNVRFNESHEIFLKNIN